MSDDLLDDAEAGELAVEFDDQPPEALLGWAFERFGSRIALCTSFQAEGMVLLDMAWRVDPKVRVFTIDTGRLHQETYDLYLRGGQGPTAAIGVPLVRRVPAEEAAVHIERLIRLWVTERNSGESFKAFADRQPDERLVAVAANISLDDARVRLRRRDSSRAEAVDVG